MPRTLKFVVTENDKTGNPSISIDDQPCIVQRKIANALHISVKRVDYGFYTFWVNSKSRKKARYVQTDTETRKLIREFDSGNKLTCGVYSVRLED